MMSAENLLSSMKTATRRHPSKANLRNEGEVSSGDVMVSAMTWFGTDSDDTTPEFGGVVKSQVKHCQRWNREKGDRVRGGVMKGVRWRSEEGMAGKMQKPVSAHRLRARPFALQECSLSVAPVRRRCGWLQL